MNNKLRYISRGITKGAEFPQYKLARGRANNPNGEAICIGDVGSWPSNINNEWILRTMVQVPRKQSIHRVSPSPRKIPQYELDIMVTEVLGDMRGNMGVPLTFMEQQVHATRVRQQMPRFR